MNPKIKFEIPVLQNWCQVLYAFTKTFDIKVLTIATQEAILLNTHNVYKTVHITQKLCILQYIYFGFEEALLYTPCVHVCEVSEVRCGCKIEIVLEVKE